MIDITNGYLITLRYYVYIFQWPVFEIQLFTIAFILLISFYNIVKYYVLLAILLLFASGVSIIFNREDISRNLGELSFLFLVISSIALFIRDRQHGKV